MSFINYRLPDCVERGATGGPEFNTTVQESYSGFEKRNVNWSMPRRTWNIGYGIDSSGGIQQEVLNLFHIAQGRARGFRFKDWSDYQIGSLSTSTPQSIAIADGVKTQFQIIKKYTISPLTFNRNITRTVAGTVDVYVNDVLQVSGFSVDNDTGVVTFTSAPANLDDIGIVCEFDVPVRFNSDSLQIRVLLSDASENPDIEIIELRENLQVLV